MKLCKKLLFNTVAAIFVLIEPQLSWGSACCGGGGSSAALITGDDQTQVTSSMTNSVVAARVLEDGVWRHVNDEQKTETLKIEMAQIFLDRYQYGITIPAVRKSQTGYLAQESSGLGDISVNLGYEYLPDWDYNPMRPKGIGFLSLVAPTGASKYESDSLVQNRGRGFWTVGAGTALTKSWVTWDASSIFEIHKSFDRTTRATQTQREASLKPGFGSSINAGLGYNIKNLRLGGNVSWQQEDAIKRLGEGESQESAERMATATLSVSYLFPDAWSGTMNYSDQTIIGSPINTSLSRSFALILQKRWLR